MMPVAELDIVKAVWEVEHTSPNTIAQNIFYWQVSGLVDGDFDLVGQDIQTALVDLYTPISLIFSTRYVLKDIRVTDETQKLFLKDGTGGGFAGTDDVSQVLPAQDAAMILARSRKLGHQGRKFLGPIVEDAVDDGAVAPAILPLLTTFGDTWDNVLNGALTTNTYTPGTVKFAEGGAVESFDAFDTNLPKALPIIRTQRRRRPTVGLS